MFDSISFSEIFTILIVVIIVFGPNRLPEMMRKLGQWTARARTSVETLRSELGSDYKDVIDPIKEVRSDLRGIRRELSDTARSVVSEVDAATKDVRDSVDVKKTLTSADIDAARGLTSSKAMSDMDDPAADAQPPTDTADDGSAGDAAAAADQLTTEDPSS